MDVERDIVWLSVPFVTGLASAAFIPSGEAYYLKAATGISISAILLFLYCRKGNRHIAGAFLFLVLGWFCYQNSTLCGMTGASSLIHPSDAFAPLIEKCAFSDKTDALLKALLTGDREALDSGTIQAFRKSGASHILALSGLHLGIIYGILTKLLSILGNSRPSSFIRSALIITACALYCTMTGCGPSIIRAFIFITINEISHHYSGRKKRPEAILCTAMTLQLTINPLVIKSVGFQLSYLAMTGIVLIYPMMEKWYPSDGGRLDIMKRIWNSAALTVSCQIFTAPLVWITFRTFPKYFLLTNLIALPMTEMLIVSSVVCIGINSLATIPAISAIPFAENVTNIAKKAVEWGTESLCFHLDVIGNM